MARTREQDELMLPDRRTVIQDCGLILGAWSAFLLVLLLLQVLGPGVGFNVCLLGEDRVWLDILQRGQDGSAANIFWRIMIAIHYFLGGTLGCEISFYKSIQVS